MMYSTYEPTLIAPLVLGSEDGTSLCACQFTSGRDAAKFCWDGAERSDQAPVFCQARSWLDRYFAGEAPDPARLCLAPRGTTFQQAVWEALLTIPYGQTVTYGWVARRVSDMRGSRTSPRAVGGAVGANPIGIIVPCHRVVGADGSRPGFGGGIKAKVALLEHEGVGLTGLTVPTRGTAL